MLAKNGLNRPWFDKVIAKIKWCSFFDLHGRSFFILYQEGMLQNKCLTERNLLKKFSF